MKRRTIVGLIIAILLIGGGWFFFKSNLLRSDARVSFVPGANNLNTMQITAPSGWHCIEFYKSRQTTTDSESSISGKGMSDCPLFGSSNVSSNHYPDHGTVENIPLEQQVLVHESDDKTYQVYVWITEDPANYDSLK